MLGLLLIYFIGKKFYELADDFDKKKWKYTIFGIILYYAGAIISGVIIGILVMVLYPSAISKIENPVVSSLIALPFGILSCYLYYMYLEKKFKNENSNSDSIEDIGTV